MLGDVLARRQKRGKINGRENVREKSTRNEKGVKMPEIKKGHAIEKGKVQDVRESV